MTKSEDEYLWDLSGDVDPEIARLEETLRPFRHKPATSIEPLAIVDSRLQARRRAPWVRRFAPGAAAAILVAAVLAWLSWGVAARQSQVAPASWNVKWLSGESTQTRLEVGAWLETAPEDRARVDVADIGYVEVEPMSRVRLIDTGPRGHRLEMTRGTLRALITAPPRIFFVETPAATAVDLGCAYTLTIDDGGAGLLHVTLGYVQLESPNLPSAFVPRDAECRSTKGRGPGLPYFSDAPPALRDVDPASADAIAAAVASARPRDSLTLWHLLARAPANLVPQVRARLFELAPPPAELSSDEVVRGTPAALESWRDHMRWTYWYE